MKKLLFTLTLAAAFSVGSQSALAQAKKTPAAPADAPATAAAVKPKAPAEKPKAPADPTKPMPMHTVVDTIDAAGKSFTHKNKDGKEVKYVTTAKTEFKNGEKDATFADIKVGNEVNGLRVKKSDTEYEVVKTTYIGAPKPKAEKPAGTEKPGKGAKPAGDAPKPAGEPKKKP